MVSAFFLSLGQLLDSRIASVFVKSLFVTGLVFAAIGAGLWFGSDRAMAAWLGWSDAGFASLAAVLLTLAAVWFLFRAVAIGVMQFFADDVIRAVEAKHYPEMLASARDLPFWREAQMGLGSAIRFILINLICLPLYIVLIVTGVGPLILGLALNGWLLGRDLGDMVGARHLNSAELRRWRSRSRFARFTLGLAIACLFVVPVANLLAPILGAAMMTHLFHQGFKA